MIKKRLDDFSQKKTDEWKRSFLLLSLLLVSVRKEKKLDLFDEIWEIIGGGYDRDWNSSNSLYGFLNVRKKISKKPSGEQFEKKDRISYCFFCCCFCSFV